MENFVDITISDRRNGQTATIELDANVSDAILFYVIKFLNYQGSNPMEAAVEFFVRQGKEVATSMIRSQGAAQTEQAVKQFESVVDKFLGTTEDPVEEPLEDPNQVSG